MNIANFIKFWMDSNRFYFKNRKNYSNLENIQKIYGYTDAQIEAITKLQSAPNIKLDDALHAYVRTNYQLPCPNYIKNSVLLRNGIAGGAWIETGTYIGDTTEVLSKFSKMVYSIEPSKDLVEKAQIRFAKTANVKILHGLSEKVLPPLLESGELAGADLNFWLDGHYSAGITHQGPKDTPIVEELVSIEKNLQQFKKVAIFIDDIRCFLPGSEYPELNFLVEWANKNKLQWHIEYDIFVAKN
jgi:hypothetical protein